MRQCFPELDSLLDRIAAASGAAAFILYGSLARGDAGPDSDIDLLCLVPTPPPGWQPAPWNGTHEGRPVDAWLVAADAAPAEEFHRITGGRILRDHEGVADKLLAAAEAAWSAPIPPLPPAEAAQLAAWVRKMLARSTGSDAAALHRRAWLLSELPELHYQAHGRRFPGPKRAIAELAAADPVFYTAFAEALAASPADPAGRAALDAAAGSVALAFEALS